MEGKKFVDFVNPIFDSFSVETKNIEVERIHDGGDVGQWWWWWVGWSLISNNSMRHVSVDAMYCLREAMKRASSLSECCLKLYSLHKVSQQYLRYAR